MSREIQLLEWNAKKLVGATAQLHLSSDILSFSVKVIGRPVFDQSTRLNQFVEGLWNQDVAELFVMEDSGRYQEFNVNAAGAWWSCTFDSYRVRSKSQAVPNGAVPKVERGNDFWIVGLEIPISELSVKPQKFHLSAITDSPQQRFFSSNPDLSVEPDFHIAEVFQNL